MSLEEATKAVRKTKNLKVFLEFLEAFKQEEEEHIRKALNPEDPKDFNLRSASLCAEAYAAAQLMYTSLTE
jgi:hypothetical protein